MGSFSIRRAEAGDLEVLAAYIAQSNADPSRQCLHTPGHRRRVLQAALLRDGGLVAGGSSLFFLATSARAGNGGISGAVGCQCGGPGGEVGWLWGPWVSEPGEWKPQAPVLLDELVKALPGSLRRLDAFLHVANRDGLAFLQKHGFTVRSPTHIYVAPETAACAGPQLPELTTRHEVGFIRLHRETFPAAESTPAEELLAGRDDEHVIFAAADDLRLQGYVCVSVNAAPPEGFIDYLAVRPSARGRGLGQQLLQTALRWSLEVRHLPQAALCVTEWRDDARRLYERAGFRLHATGRGARRRL